MKTIIAAVGRYSSNMRLLRTLLLTAAGVGWFLGGAQVSLGQTKAQAASGTPAFAPRKVTPGSADWALTPPSPLDTITWTSGDNAADGKNFARKTYGPEPKFVAIPTPPGVAGRVPFTGFTRTDTNFSKAITSGTGNSAVAVNIFGNPAGAAVWSVVATGTLGKPPAPTLPSYFSQATGDDPWLITASELSGLKSPDYSLFIPVGLGPGAFSPTGHIAFDVTYSTASSTIDLLNIAISTGTVSVTSGDASAISLYSIPGIYYDPRTPPGAAMSLADLQASLASDIGLGMKINDTHLFGIDLEGVPVPGVEMEDGAVAQIDETLYVDDSKSGPATTPEPSSLFLFGSGILGMAGVLRKRLLT